MNYIFSMSILSNVGDAIVQAIRTLMGALAATLYNFIVNLYSVFMIIARAEVLDNEYIQLIYNRVGIILGLFMIFKLSFSLIQSLIDPDKFTDKKKGFSSIIYRTIIAIVLLGVTPSIFRFAFDFQNLVVGTENDSNNVLYKLVVSDDVVHDTGSFGRTMATDLYFSFFREKPGLYYTPDIREIYEKDVDGGLRKTIIFQDYNTLKEWSYDGKMGDENFDFNDLLPFLSMKKGGEYIFQWDIIFSVATAGVVIWILINYCISVATRVIQLAYLQLIAPVPILSYINDSEGTFKKWINQCVATYADLFLRLLVLYFIINLCTKIMNILNDTDGKLFESTGITTSSPEYIWVKILLIIGLLMFGKRVPQLLKELFPGLGSAASFDLGIKSPKALVNDIPIAGSYVAKGFGVAKKVAGAPINFAKGKFDNFKKGKLQAMNTLRKESHDAAKAERLLKDGQVADVNTIAKSFHNDEYAESYRNVQAAKKAMSQATNPLEYSKAAASYDKAKKRHELMQQRYTHDAKIEQRWDALKLRNPSLFASGSTSSNSSTSNASTSGSTFTSAPPRSSHTTSAGASGPSQANPTGTKFAVNEHIKQHSETGYAQQEFAREQREQAEQNADLERQRNDIKPPRSDANHPETVEEVEARATELYKRNERKFGNDNDSNV